MKNIVFHSDGFGDLLVCFKALYAIKQLYPEYKLFLLTNGLMESDFLEKIPFIDEVLIYKDDFLEKIQSKNPVIFITTRRQGLYFKKLKFLNVQKCIVFPHLISIISKNLTTPLPFFRAKKHMSEIVLKLVRMINTRHFDKNFNQIDFSKIKNLLPYDARLSDNFFKQIDTKYEKIIGINAFSNNSEYRGFNFFIKDWIGLARQLSLKYPKFLFILLNFSTNSIQYNIDQNANLKVFCNNKNIASLVSISQKLDFLITVDTEIYIFVIFYKFLLWLLQVVLQLIDLEVEVMEVDLIN
ncbi:glycosyltransferase family 9 protein [Campylobacter coli]